MVPMKSGYRASHALAMTSSLALSPATRWTPRLRVATAAAFVLSSGLLLVGDVLAPSGADYVASMAARPDSFGLAVAVSLLAVPFLVATAVAWTALTLGRSPRLAWPGGALMVTGACGLAAVLGAETAQYSLLVAGVDPATVARGLEEASGAPLIVLLIMFVGGTVLGILLLLIALWRARAVPRGAVIVFLAFMIIDFSPLTAVVPFPKHLVMLVAMVWMAASILGAGRTPLFASGADPAPAH